MKTVIVLICLVCAVALSLRLGYITGRADGWQLADNDAQTESDFRMRATIQKEPLTAEDIDRLWQSVTFRARLRHNEWRDRSFVVRNEPPRPIWKGDGPPVAWIPVKRPPPVQVSIFPLSDMDKTVP